MLGQYPRHAKEYFSAIGNGVFFLIASVLAQGAGVVSSLTGEQLILPGWAWNVVGFVALLVVPFIAFSRVCADRDKIRESIASIEAVKKHEETLAALYERLYRLACSGAKNKTEYEKWKSQFAETAADVLKSVTEIISPLVAKELLELCKGTSTRTEMPGSYSKQHNIERHACAAMRSALMDVSKRYSESARATIIRLRD